MVIVLPLCQQAGFQDTIVAGMLRLRLSMTSGFWYYVPVKYYYVYILANKTGSLYTGITGDLEYRVYQHKHKLVEGFTKRYGIDRLVYYEQTDSVEAAIAREKQIKGWLRQRKIELIKSMNPKWEDLSAEWFED